MTYWFGCQIIWNTPWFQFFFDSMSDFNYAYRSQTEQNYWSSMVSFYLGCSFGFEGSLMEAGIPVRNVEQGTNVSMYKVCYGFFSNKLFKSWIMVRDQKIFNTKQLAQYLYKWCWPFEKLTFFCFTILFLFYHYQFLYMKCQVFVYQLCAFSSPKCAFSSQ